MNRLRILMALFCCLHLHAISAQTPDFIRDGLDRYIEQYMAAFKIPGLSICIIKDGAPVVEKGYGVIQIGDTARVTEHTRFMVASNSKLFTGTALAMLEQQKKINLDDPVVKYLPDFRLFDSVVSPIATVRDVLSHRMGTITFQGDFTFWGSNLSRSEIVRRMRYMQPRHTFRQNYGYCNAGFVVAGEVLQAVDGRNWETFVAEQFFKPLGMTQSKALGIGADKLTNMAAPYTTANGILERVPFDKIDNFGPAASIISSAHDMGLWLQCQLDSGRVKEKTIIPWEALRKTRQGNTVLSSTHSSAIPRNFLLYGLGVMISDYNGRQMYNHTGGAYGYVTGTCFVPEERLGIVILTNQDNQAFFESLRLMILDAYLDMPYTDRAAPRLIDQVAVAAEIEAEAQQFDSLITVRDFDTTTDPEAFHGTFTHPLYGRLICKANPLEDNVLIEFAHHPELCAYLEPINTEQAILSYNHPGYGRFLVPFKMDDAKVTELNIRVSDFLETEFYTFKRI